MTRLAFKRTILGGLLAVLAGGGLFFLSAGSLLVVEDSFDHADVALALSGRPTPRALAARDLLQENRVDQIWVVSEPPAAAPIEEALRRIGLSDPKAPSFSERILRASGVDLDRVTFLPHANSTLEEARIVRAHLAALADPPARLVLVTSDSHTRRARFLFRSILRNRPVEVLAYPSPYDASDPRRWWTRRKEAMGVLDEYVKLLANAVELLLSTWHR